MYGRAAAEVGLEVDVASIDAAFGEVFEDMNQQHPAFGAATGISSRSWWELAVARTFLAAGVPRSRSGQLITLGGALYEQYKGGSCWRLFDDALPAVSALHKAGIHLAVLSNFDERLHGILADLRLRHLFDTVLTSRELGCDKPAAASFQALVEAAQGDGCDDVTIVHIGDSRRKDYDGARAAGLQAAVLCRQRGSVEACKEGEVPSLTAFADAVLRGDY